MDDWNTLARVIAILAGVTLGSASISTACWVWLRKQIFAYGGSALCGAGVILLGLSIWHSVEFGVTGTGMTLKMQADLNQQIHDSVSAAMANATQSLPSDWAANADLVHKTYGLQADQAAQAAIEMKFAADRLDQIVSSSKSTPKDVAEAAKSTATLASQSVNAAVDLSRGINQRNSDRPMALPAPNAAPPYEVH